MAYQARRVDERGVLANVNLSPSDLLTAAASGAVHVAKRHPIKVSTYILGLLVGIFFTGLSISTAQMQAYEAALPDAHQMRKLSTLEVDTARAYSRYYESKGWFTCDARCTVNYNEYTKAKEKQDVLARTLDTQLKQARGILGVFSTQGVDEAKGLFWAAFNRGKKVAQRQTMWDAFFVGMRSMGRDEGLASYIVDMLLRFLSNLFVSLMLSLFSFAWSLWELCTAYNAGIAVGLAFWILGTIAAGSFLLTAFLGFTVAIGGTVAGVVYVAGSTAATRRLEGAGGQAYPRMRRD